MSIALSDDLKERKAQILKALDELGVTNVHVEWCGSGDSGGIESVTAKDAEQDIEIDLEKTRITMDVIVEESIDTGRKQKDGTPIYKKVGHHENQEMSLEKAVEQFSYDLMNETDASSFDNDGAQGSLMFEWDKKKKLWTVHYEHSFNVSNSETQFDEDI